jgi:hypothetical protein
MGEANRRRSRIEAEGEIKGDMAEICAETAAYLLNDSADRTLLVGPVSGRPSDGTSPRLYPKPRHKAKPRISSAAIASRRRARERFAAVRVTG